MQRFIRIVLALVAMGFSLGAATAAESKAVQVMAGILTTLQHVPSADAKQVLEQIAVDKATTADERAIAKALANVQHKVAAGDKAGLEAIVSDAKSSAAAKTLAGVLLAMNHFPSAADKEKLAALVK